MTTNLVVYESVGHKARAVARVFLGECATDAPRRLADFLRSKKLDVVQFAWNFQLDDGTVDIRDEYPRPGETLKQLVTEYVNEWVENVDSSCEEECSTKQHCMRPCDEVRKLYKELTDTDNE